MSANDGNGAVNGSDAGSLDLLKNLLILQHQAVKALIVEVHQQTEAYIQQYDRHPFTQQVAAAAHADKVPLRELSTSAFAQTDGCVVSALVQEAIKAACDADACIVEPSQLSTFLAMAHEKIKTSDDRVHVLFVLDSTLTNARQLLKKKKQRQAVDAGGSNREAQWAENKLRLFEREKGYDLVVDWFAECCSYTDEGSRALTELVLLVLQRNLPMLPLVRKTMVKRLNSLKKVVSGRSNKELFLSVVTQYREIEMEGFLDHLESPGPAKLAMLHKKTWTRRFFKLNSTFHVLEFFTDEMQQTRKGKLELRGAVVATADELGELLLSSKAAVEKSRRFVFRVTENGSKTHHYLCAEIDARALATASREYMEEWVHALQTSVLHDHSGSLATVGLSELNAQIVAFMNHMHLSAHVTNRSHEHGKAGYEVTVKAWILVRELVMDDAEEEDDGGRRSVGSGDMSWQILEYSCAWKLVKSTAELRGLDSQLRQFLGVELRDLAFPASTIATKLKELHVHASSSQKEAENLQHMQAVDTYLQTLLSLPAFSSFGNEASTMLDTFLEMSSHLASFRKLEKETGASMHLRQRNVVPWEGRERFEVLYKTHLEVMAAQGERTRRADEARAASHRKELRAERPHQHQHHHRLHKADDIDIDGEIEAQEPDAAIVTPLPAPAKLAVTAEVRSLSEVCVNSHC
ncbi:hypothetical protein BBJ28_00011778 [Nothophytophthora sp. Chile5]|nr:hypothetical protein BBJ28_00011778 [Nothophytophthora sp. Chile5]